MGRKSSLPVVHEVEVQICERLSARLTTEVCAKRWCKANAVRGWRTLNVAVLYESCASCGIGRANALRHARGLDPRLDDHRVVVDLAP